MKRRFLLILIAVCAIFIGLVSCKKEKEESAQNQSSRYTIEGVTDISLSSDQTEYDFLKGVVGWDGNTLKPVQVNSSAVQFGTAGAYEITYTLENVTQKATVRVYGAPQITGEAIYEANYRADLDACLGVSGKDSFGVELEVTTNNEFERDSFGRIVYGEHFFRYFVTDSVGNSTYLDRMFTVLPPEGYNFDNVVVTSEKPEAIIDISGKALEKVIYQGQIVDATLYQIEGDSLDVIKLAIALGKGQHTCELSFAGGYANVVIDMQISAQQYYARPIEGEEMVKLFEPYLADGVDYGNNVYWDEEEGAFHFVNYVTAQDDIRGFFMNNDFFHELIATAKAKSMTFEMKFDYEGADSVEFYQGFIPEWWDSTWEKMQWKHYVKGGGYQTVTVDFSKVDKVGDKYKTLFMLATKGGFYIKNIQIEFEAEAEAQATAETDVEAHG